MNSKFKISRKDIIRVAIIVAIGGFFWRFDFRLLSLLRGFDNVDRNDLYYLFKVWGSKWTWILLAAALTLQLRHSRRGPGPALADGSRHFTLPIPKEAIYLLISPLLSGAVAELLKMTIRRLRPSEVDAYLFRALSDLPFSTKALGLPSSHAATAFGGSLALITLFPALRWPALVMALGCALTRVVSGAHYPTDVFGGALVGLLVSHLLCEWLRLEPQRANPSA